MSTMQAAADARKAKLAALKKRKTLHDSADNQVNPSPGGDKPEVFKFRNYDPETGAMRKHQRTEEEDTVEKQAEGLTEAAIAQEQATRNQELDLTNIQPKKPNWDLKRDLERKLAKLKPKTDHAISTLIRQRLTAEKSGAAAAAGLVAAAGQGGPEPDSDEPDSD